MKKKKIEHLAWLSAEIAFLCVGIIIIKFQNKYSILYSIFYVYYILYIYHVCVCVCIYIYIYNTVLSVNESTPLKSNILNNISMNTKTFPKCWQD